MKGCRRLFALWILLCLVSLRGEGEAPSASAGGVVSLSPALTELAFYLGGGEQLVGRSSACDYPEEAKALPVMGDFALPELERILAASPRVVVSNDLVNPSVARALESRGIALELLPCRSVGEYLRMVERMGELLGRREAAQRECARVQEFLSEASSWEAIPGKVGIFVWSSPVILAGEGTFCQEVLRLAGGTPLDFQGRSGFFTPGNEWLLGENPRVVLVFREPTSLPLQKALEGLRGRMVRFPQEDLLLRPSPRWTEGVRRLRGMLLRGNPE